MCNILHSLQQLLNKLLVISWYPIHFYSHSYKCTYIKAMKTNNFSGANLSLFISFYYYYIVLLICLFIIGFIHIIFLFVFFHAIIENLYVCIHTPQNIKQNVKFETYQRTQKKI